jgi:hypothetical protein
MHACDAAVRSRARENSPGTRVRGGEQGVRLFSSFSPLTFRVPHPADDRASIYFFCPFRTFFFNS